ncbi:amidohydrolase [Microbacterium oxydans]|uniref:N-substituted formamide deformylase n=1 Tax=Microbacterium oxydans TaxID=82380 RepID=A0A0F0LDB0_9MICO|nr:amidohydrolase [Microbacterium oxydans]KJL29546.1 N-substituted formamide deformylase precursor [Microbacterium oxydans]
MRVDTIFTNARIRTLDAARPSAHTIGTLNGRIVGLDDDLHGVDADRIVDLGGQPVLPGFHDAHHHLSLTGFRLASLNLRPGAVNSLAELYEAVRKHAEGLAPDAWVRGSGYDQNFLEAHPTAEGLDRVAGGRPVILEHVSGHMMVANTPAFELAGYAGREDFPEIAGGGIPREADGRPQGLLQESAMAPIFALVRPVDLGEVQRNLQLASDQALRYGLTSVTEPGIGEIRMVGNSPLDYHAYQTAVEQRQLRVRTTLMPYITVLHPFADLPDKDVLGLDLGIRTGLGDDMLRVGPVKIVADGSFIGRSAAMHACFHGEADNFGVLLHQPEQLHDYIVGAHRAGWTVATHAIGDRAITHVLDAVEEAQRIAPRPGVRHRIEHFALASDADIARAARLGVIPVPQGVFVSDFGDGMAAAVAADRRDDIYRVKSLADAGIVLNGSTDSPISDANPLVSLRDMVLRRTSGGHVLGERERVSVDEAIRAYTYGSAYAVSQEHATGTLRVGMLADFIALSDDLYAIDPERIAEQQVTATVVGGELVFGEEA